jgi:hypothetical protein
MSFSPSTSLADSTAENGEKIINSVVDFIEEFKKLVSNKVKYKI